MSEPWPEREVVLLATPPVRQSTTVRAGVERTFDVFVDEIGAWWPIDPFSRGGAAEVRDVRVERRVGGSVREIWHDGTTHTWGELSAWDPPHGFTMSWLLTPVATEVELTFRALGPNLTRVDVEHRGWERMSGDQLAAACALPEGYVGGSFHRGWGIILGELARHAGPRARATRRRGVGQADRRNAASGQTERCNAASGGAERCNIDEARTVRGPSFVAVVS